LSVPVRYPAVAPVGQTIYVFGGETTDGRPTDAIQEIDTSSGRVSLAGHLPHRLAHASAVSLGGRIYVLGGTDAKGPTTEVLGFDPSTGRASPAGRLPTPVTNGAAAALGGTGY